jgi:hypothetical protein
MRHRFLAFVLLLCAVGPADAAHGAAVAATEFSEQQFLVEYAMGVQRLPMDGGKIYGWKISNHVTFGRFKGESDEFGFSIDLNRRQRVEITTEGVRWRQTIGGGH